MPNNVRPTAKTKNPPKGGLGVSEKVLLSVRAIFPELKTLGVFVAPIVIGVDSRAGFYWFDPENARGFSAFDLPEKQVRQVSVRKFEFNHDISFGVARPLTMLGVSGFLLTFVNQAEVNTH